MADPVHHQRFVGPAELKGLAQLEVQWHERPADRHTALLRSQRTGELGLLATTTFVLGLSKVEQRLDGLPPLRQCVSAKNASFTVSKWCQIITAGFAGALAAGPRAQAFAHCVVRQALRPRKISNGF
ncbi:hypothetical protein [Variovorax sp. EBFNA2]|uniref:hypothetical protein n=1 Tax=Variovorax sp. EBFNA2 TaxID=3342097 RepID=UPI0029C039CE|nr:hypothetical protein [Variovorax boronicumulans]WPG41587.1 hypothetical protein RZE79_32295 [Variovorax boronicumulans]